MQNFTYSIPTKVYFGKGQVENLGAAVKAYGQKALLVYGGSSIKRTGLYDKVVQQLKDNGVQWVEQPGVEPNPRIETVRAGAQKCRENGVDVVLAVGGGSTIDASKAIAYAANYDGDAWDFIVNPSLIEADKVLPIVTVLTLAATGSEMDAGGVVTNPATGQKLHFFSPGMLPKVSILDPTITYTVSAYQTASGTADIYSHILESYFNTQEGTFMDDRCAEALMKTVLHYGPIAVKEPENYEARANLMWASSWAINGFIEMGKVNQWSVHNIEHQLSAQYDMPHGIGLAVLTPNWMKYILSDKTVDKFATYGINVFGLDAQLDKYLIANTAIEATRAFFHSMGIIDKLSEYKDGVIDDSKFEQMAQTAYDEKGEGMYVPLKKDDIKKIYEMSL